MKTLVIGGGHHGKVVIDTLLKMGEDLIGILVADENIGDQQILGLPVLGDDGAIQNWPPESVSLAMGIGSTDVSELRRNIFHKFQSKGYKFATLSHPSAVIGFEVELGEGVQIMAGVVVQPGVVIGTNSILNTACSVDHDCVIGAHTHIAPGATLSGGVIVGDETHIGAGATIIQGVTIGNRCLISAGATVIHNVEDGQKVPVNAIRPTAK